MNKLLIPLVILLSSLIYSLLWNQYRKPYCTTQTTSEETVKSEVEATPLPPPEATAPVTEEPAPPVVEKTNFESIDVYFNSGSSTINRTQEVNAWLEMAKQYLSENPGVKLSLVGHTDNTGSTELNQTISERRAAAVKNILIADGFTKDNLEVSGKGESEPIADNNTEDGKAKNRRVSIRLIR